MPLIDKPLAELKTYRGTNPRPADFDEFWENALTELYQTDPQSTLTPSSEFSARNTECFDLTFQGVGGATVYAKYLRPVKRETQCPAVLNFHGYSGSSSEWTSYLPYVSEGFCVAAMDCRGQGGRSQDSGSPLGTTLRGHIIRGLDDKPEHLLYRNIFLDTAQLARVVANFEEVDNDRMGAYGGSQGGGLTLACAALAPEIKRAAPMYPFLCDYRRVWDMDLCKGAYEELSYYFRLFDPLHEREDEIFTKLGYIDCQFLAPRIKAKILMGTGLSDTICPPSTQFAAYNKITSSKEMLIYPDFGHEGLRGFADHTFQFLTKL